MRRLQASTVVLSLATAFAPAMLTAQNGSGAVPGSLNFVQGQVNIDGQPFQSDLTPSVSPRRLNAGQTLATANGAADILLAPGALLRLGQDTTVRMVAGEGDRTEIRLEQGTVNLNVNHVSKDHLLLLDLPHGQTQIVSPGLYAFTGADSTLRVFNGQVNLFLGADPNTDVKPIKVKEGHEVIVGGDRAKPEKFDRQLAENDLLPWNGPHAIGKPLPDSVFNYGSAAGFDGGAYTGLGFGGIGYGFGGLGYGGGYGLGYGFGYPGLYAGGFGPFGFGSPYGYGFGPFGFGGYPYGGYYGGGYYGGLGGYPTGSGGRSYPLRGPGRLGNGTASGLAGNNGATGSFRGGAPVGNARSAAPSGGAYRGGASMGAGGMRSGGGFGGGGGGARGGGGGGHR